MQRERAGVLLLALLTVVAIGAIAASVTPPTPEPSCLPDREPAPGSGTDPTECQTTATGTTFTLTGTVDTSAETDTGTQAASPTTPDDRSLSLPVDLVLGLGGILAAGGILVVLLALTRDRDTATGDEDDAAGELDALGEAAGDAADRIESGAGAEVDNAVYEAWREMVRYLDVPDPETLAPDEFATAAIEAGMDPDDVRTLTRLFEEVRYGGADPAERADRAVDALRHVEETYTTDEEGDT